MNETETQHLLHKVDRRDKIVRAIEVVILFVLAIVVFVTLLRLQSVIDQNQVNALQARKANIERQKETQDYIKCVLLLRYDTTPEELATRKGAEKALDRCASTNN